MMITVAAMAAVLGVFRVVIPWILPLLLVSPGIVAFLALVLFLALVEFFVCSADFRSDRRRAGHSSREANRPIAKQEPAQSGEAERV
jgi:hypothetical protein